MIGVTEEPAYITVPGVGRSIAMVPVIPEDAPGPVREGVARQRIAAITGSCLCGAQVEHRSAGGGLHFAEVYHDRRCPGQSDRLREAMRRWSR